jgi:hypothetical protein
MDLFLFFYPRMAVGFKKGTKRPLQDRRGGKVLSQFFFFAETVVTLCYNIAL